MGIYEEIEAETLEEELTVQKIAHRVLANKELLEAKFARKTASEALYYQNKEGTLAELV